MEPMISTKARTSSPTMFKDLQTRAKLAGKSETLHYEFPDGRHMLIRPTEAAQHWSVLWERY